MLEKQFHLPVHETVAASSALVTTTQTNCHMILEHHFLRSITITASGIYKGRMHNLSNLWQSSARSGIAGCYHRLTAQYGIASYFIAALVMQLCAQTSTAIVHRLTIPISGQPEILFRNWSGLGNKRAVVFIC